MSFNILEELTLQDVAIKITDGTHSTVKNNINGKCYLLSAKNIKNGQIVIQESDRKIDLDTMSKLNKRTNMDTGDVLITTVGTLGESALIKDRNLNYEFQRSVAIIKPDTSKILPEFLYYMTLSNDFKSQVEGYSSGSVQKCLFLGAINSIKIKIPAIAVQKKISEMLTSLDEKIEVNNQINKNLEKMAKAIYKSWFIDFEPFQEGEFLDSEIGMIPKGWKVGPVENFFEISIGKTPPRKESIWFSKDRKDVKWVSITDMGKSGLYIFDTNERLTSEAISKHNIKIIPAETVLLSFKLTIGRISITSDDVTTNEAIAHFKNDKNNINEYLYYFLKNFNFDSLGNTSSIATAVNSKVIKRMKILVPEDKVLNDFHYIVSKIMIKIKNNEIENQKLESIRDTLLPKLMSGEIRIPIEE
ncbi:MAG: type I restriction enzyme S subunit [Fusobacteria bacterium]|nr:MAG: type I restriction enzyme S subunit [Fusobacteriota bacterium]KAF0228610.1 MAG: type I restriction enzyme S [Fusobacteriota bacterium]